AARGAVGDGEPDAEVLEALADGQPKTSAALREAVAPVVGVTDAERAERIPSGARLFDNRVHWAVTYLVQAGLIQRPKRGVVQITERDREVLAVKPGRIDNDLLDRFPEFVEFKNRTGTRPRAASDAELTSPATAETPTERLSEAVEKANGVVAEELLRRIREREPAFLEDLVLELLTSMGYGGRDGAAEHLGQSGDQGLDGVIRQDALGLDRVYVQAKRYAVDSPIGRPEIQAFVGALQGAQADRGIFITTSRFTNDARDYAERVSTRLVLIDGWHLGGLMVRHDIGVQAEETFVLKQIDEDYFEA
ncbi:MAG: restriction endonuclease, partial [Nitriliruptoraceae bacterium]